MRRACGESSHGGDTFCVERRTVSSGALINCSIGMHTNHAIQSNTARFERAVSFAMRIGCVRYRRA